MLYFMGCMFFSNFSCQPYVINIQLRNTDNICTDLYILLKPQSQLGYLGFNQGAVKHGRGNGCVTPDLSVMRDPPPRILNEDGVGM